MDDADRAAMAQQIREGIDAGIRHLGCECDPTVTVTAREDDTDKIDVRHDNWCRLLQTLRAEFN